MFIWNCLAFSMIHRMLVIWSLVPLPFLNPVWTSGSSQFVLLKPGLENFEHYFVSTWDEYCRVVLAPPSHSLVLTHNPDLLHRQQWCIKTFGLQALCIKKKKKKDRLYLKIAIYCWQYCLVILWGFNCGVSFLVSG